MTEASADKLSAEFLLFSIQSQFLPPRQAISNIACLRQLATSLGDAKSLVALHLSVARIEGYHGDSDSARVHLGIAERLSSHARINGPLCSCWLIEASLEMYAGSLRRAGRAARRCFEVSTREGLLRHRAGSLGNLGLLALCAGKADVAESLLTDGLKLCDSFSFVRLALTDSRANLGLYRGQLDLAADLIDECQALIATHKVPARSWYDLTHQLTRCLFHGLREEWQAVVDIVDAADPELERRQLRTWRASLLAARARAQAQLGQHDAAEQSLLAAMRACPKGAVDPMVAIETAAGVCLATRGEVVQAQRHFDRATRACEAIEHRFLGWIVDQARRQTPAASQATPDRRRYTETEDTALLLADASAILSTAHTLDLMAERVRSILDATPLRQRVDITKTPQGSDQPGVTAAWEFRGSHGCRIALTGSDRTITFDVRDLASLEEVALLKSLTDIIAAAVGHDEDADTQLWPTRDVVAPDDAVFWSPRMQELLRIAERLAATDLPILITGETGTGKEVFARLIHDHSRVRKGPFVPFNASAIPRDLVESQLFGHRRGAFTGAHDTSPGIIRSADQGTLFLDEIGDLEPGLQPKLLRFLESGEILPVGEPRPQVVRVRVVAATNARLESLVDEGRFRADLFYRLRVATLSLPPLRERKDEIPALVALFVRKAMAECGRRDLQVSDDLVAATLLYDWPGNLRQLFNELRRVVAMAADGATLTSADLSPDVSGPWRTSRPAASAPSGPAVMVSVDQPLELAIQEVERAFIERALAQTQGRVTDAAQLLGISRKGLFVKRRKLGLN